MAQKPLNWHSTAVEALRGADLTCRTALVTGGNSGIGVETVRALAAAGARVVLTSRSLSAGEDMAANLRKDPHVKGEIAVLQVDLADLASVRAMAKAFLARERGPDLLILNAGIMMCPLQYTKDGFEMQIGTNHFGHFALTQALLPSMRALGRPARVVAVSSMGHQLQDMKMGDLHYKNRRYTSYGSYGSSKLANILFAKELARRLKGSSIEVFSLHPGVIQTPLGRHVGTARGTWTGWLFGWLGAFWIKSTEQGAATTVTAAVSPELAGESGAYLTDCQIAVPSKEAQDEALAKELWDVTERQLAEAEAARAKA
ncbi:hypothetical protein WJX81_004012 [Elliptochloris bilobata]|uniref:Uncharacterized protein n=1 Tax=Elliptochloris bilobata TaxID=381761 RepID=A0AAW1RUI4_9CHLO